MTIRYPSEEQIRASVREICEQAPLTKRPTIRSFLRDMSRNLGLRQIFAGTWDVIAICCTLFAVVGVVGAMELRTSVDPQQQVSVFLFAFSPVFLFLLFSLSIWNKTTECPSNQASTYMHAHSRCRRRHDSQEYRKHYKNRSELSPLANSRNHIQSMQQGGHEPADIFQAETDCYRQQCRT